jgi:hypothetical protein
MSQKFSRLVRLTLFALPLAFLAGAAASLATASDDVVFSDVVKQTHQFMGYERSIQLTPAQEAVKKAALGAIPAPCCSDNSAYTCCCPCNMSRAVWGLANHLIADRGMDAEGVKKKAQEWFQFINPDGFSGDVCYTAGGCNRPFAKNGCGGMSPNKVVF